MPLEPHFEQDAIGPELMARADAIRLPLKRLAAAAGVDKHTLVRLRRPSRYVRHRTISKVRAVIEREELHLRDYLIALHGLPQVTAERGVVTRQEAAA